MAKAAHPRPERPERLSFDSEDFPITERFPLYREMNAGGVWPKAAGPAFRMRVERWRLDRAVLHEHRFSDVIHELDGVRANAAGLDHFLVTLVRSGQFEVDTGAGFTPVRPGCVSVIDVTRPMRNRATDAHTTTVSIARKLVLTTGANEMALHGLVLDQHRSALLADFLMSLVDRIDDLPVDAIVAVTHAVIALLAIALRPNDAVEPRPGAVDRLSRLGGIRRAIEQRLGDPQFGPEAAIEQSGLSRATLYRLFKSHGGLAAYIQKRRIDRVRVALSDPAEKRPLSQIAAAAGFVSESHCSRVFQTFFDMRPGQYRAELIRARAEGLPEPRLHHWHDDLR